MSCKYSTQRKKIFENASDAIKDIPDGSKLLVGGFGLCGIPEKLIAALHQQGAKDLTVVSNNAGMSSNRRITSRTPIKYYLILCYRD